MGISIIARFAKNSFMTLMCKNTPVYDISKNQIINEALVPGAILRGMGFETWMRHRRSVLSNVMARRLFFNAFGYGTDERAESLTHILSLSDCYWKKPDGEDMAFEQISPYYEPFWNGEGRYEGGAIPSLYTAGAVSKYWIDKDTLYKSGCAVELEIYALLKNLNIECCAIASSGDNSGVLVKNFTDADTMLETAICSGRFGGTYFPTVDEVISAFGEPGIKMLVIDAITGNTDRHLENFGFLRSANTGEYLGMAPLYDFDHALEADGTDDFLLSNVPEHPITFDICNSVTRMSVNKVFKMRARVILNKMGMPPD